jgi:hypothetical protein
VTVTESRSPSTEGVSNEAAYYLIAMRLWAEYDQDTRDTLCLYYRIDPEGAEAQFRQGDNPEAMWVGAERMLKEKC